MKFLKIAAASSMALLVLTATASADIITNYNVTPDSPGVTGSNDGTLSGPTDPAPGFFGGANNNTASFVVQTDTLTNIQLGLKIDTANVGPILYSDSNGNYVEPDTSNTDGRAAWDFFFSINVNANGQTSTVLQDYTYNVMVTDLTTGAMASYDPLGAGNDDSGYGPNGVTQGDNKPAYGVTAIGLDPSSEWIAQNAENIGFDFLMGSSFNGADAYEVTLQVFNPDSSLEDSESVTVNATPEPGTIGLMMGSIGALGFLVRRRRKAA